MCGRHWSPAVVLTLVAAVGACSPPISSRPADSAPSLDTSAEGRVEFGCAFERGFPDNDGVIRHYGNMAARELFRAALADRNGYRLAAQLWNAADEVADDESSDDAHQRLLDFCGAAGHTEVAGIPDLRAYLCAVNADLARERPTLGSYGAQETRVTAGDPRRMDLKFTGIAQFLLAHKEGDYWLDFTDAWIASVGGDDAEYRTALTSVARLCEDS